MLLFGGTFDPIHLGHLNMAEQCLAHFNTPPLYFMPNAIPAHKTTSGINNQDKLAMLALAIGERADMCIDERELKRSGPSYSLLSLQEIRAELDAQGQNGEPILFLLGMDSFNSFDLWYCWQDILNLCHLVVYQRPLESLRPSADLSAYLSTHQSTHPHELLNTRSGLIYFLQGPEHTASSSQVREYLQSGKDAAPLLPQRVNEYILRKRLYIGAQ